MRYWSKSAFIKSLTANFRWNGTSTPDQCWCYYSFIWYQNISSVFFHFVTKHAHDGRTDRITISNTTLVSLLRAVIVFVIFSGNNYSSAHRWSLYFGSFVIAFFFMHSDIHVYLFSTSLCFLCGPHP